MTDNIFEIETTAQAHVACAPQDSGVLLTDFAAAYPSVNHSWIVAGLGHPMDPGVSVQNKKNFTGNSKKLAKAIASLKSFTLTIPWKSAKLVKIFPGIIARLHHTDQLKWDC